MNKIFAGDAHNKGEILCANCKNCVHYKNCIYKNSPMKAAINLRNELYKRDRLFLENAVICKISCNFYEPNNEIAERSD